MKTKCKSCEWGKYDNIFCSCNYMPTKNKTNDILFNELKENVIRNAPQLALGFFAINAMKMGAKK